MPDQLVMEKPAPVGQLRQRLWREPSQRSSRGISAVKTEDGKTAGLRRTGIAVALILGSVLCGSGSREEQSGGEKTRRMLLVRTELPRSETGNVALLARQINESVDPGSIAAHSGHPASLEWTAASREAGTDLNVGWWVSHAELLAGIQT